MSTNAVGIIFSNPGNKILSRLTYDRTLSAIPYACRYRLIDFALSNMVNSDISSVNVIASYNYRSLLEHIGSGKDWDLARRSGGINIISPFQPTNSDGARSFKSHIESLISIREYIYEFKEEFVVLTDSNCVLNIDLSDVIKRHASSNAQITFVTALITPEYTSKIPVMLVSSSSGRITDISLGTSYNQRNPELALNIFVLRTNELKKMIEEAIAYSKKSFTEMLIDGLKRGNYQSYCFDGYFAHITSFLDYYKHSILLTGNCDARTQLLSNPHRPIYTRVHNSFPTFYSGSGRAENSIIADECEIKGEVINSVIFRGVHVGEGCKIVDSIIFHGSYIDRNASLVSVVSDKNVYITRSSELKGTNSLPIYIEKGRKV